MLSFNGIFNILFNICLGLLDPKWIEQRDRQIAERREQEEVYAPGSAIDDHLKHLAERRTDIFGSGAEETQIGKKVSLKYRRVENSEERSVLSLKD